MRSELDAALMAATPASAKLANIVLGSVLFAEIPQELTVSSRIKRHTEGEPGWRKVYACWVRDHLLAPFDPTGRHG